MRSRKTTRRQRLIWFSLFIAAALGLGVVLNFARLYLVEPKPTSPYMKVRSNIPVQEASRRQVHLYFAASAGSHLQAEERKLEVSDTLSTMESIISALLEGPRDSRLTSTIPTGTQLLHLFINSDGTAYLDFTAELSRLHPGGIRAELLTLYGIVNSLVLNLDEVERVQLLLEGKPTSTLNGHLDIDHPIAADLLIIR
jgi:spore germination protein GerM